MAYFGFLNINKPAGVTSRWVVDRVQRLVRPEKAGHAGTLDPLATGVLVVAIGQATRLIEYVQRMRKHYRATFLLGRSSDTEDTDGVVVELENPPIPTMDDIESAAAGMIGELEQRPPAYSAVKVAGQRAYTLARAGKTVELAARPVTVHRIDVVAYDYPQLTLEIECGGGTYVRTLGRELAERCGTSAVMSALERTAIGPFNVVNAIGVDALSAECLQANLLPPTMSLGNLPSIVVTDLEVGRLRNGQVLHRNNDGGEVEIIALDAVGNLIAILERHSESLRPTRVFCN